MILSAVGFATKAIFVKLAYRHGVDAITLLALRMLFAQAFLVVFWLARASRRAATDASAGPRLARRDLWRLIGLGLLGYYLSSLLDFLGLTYISAALERLILFLYPTLVVLFSALLLGRGISRRTWIALAACYLGIALVVGGDLGAPVHHLWLGVGLVFASTITYSLYLVGHGELVRRLGPLRVSDLVTTASSTAVVLQFLVMRPLSVLAQPAPVLGYAAVMGLVATILPIYLLAAGIARIGAGRAAMLSSVGPVVTIALGVLVLGERLAPMQVVGAACVIAGVTLVARDRG